MVQVSARFELSGGDYITHIVYSLWGLLLTHFYINEAFGLIVCLFSYVYVSMVSFIAFDNFSLQIVESDGQHKLAGLLPARNDNERYLFRSRRMFSIPRVKPKRFRNCFIMHYADKQQL